MIYFLYDEDGYYLGNSTVEDEKSTTIEPELKNGFWSKFNGKKWTTEKIPDSAKDLENMIIVSDESLASNHDKEVYSLFQKFLDDTHYIEEDFENKTLTFKAYSEEELEEQKAQKEDEEKQQALDVAIDDLIKEMAKADLMGDENWKAELREQYNALMESKKEEE